MKILFPMSTNGERLELALLGAVAGLHPTLFEPFQECY